MDIMASNLQSTRQVVEQLKREAAIQRIPVSQACNDIIKYVTEHTQQDYLLVGFPNQRDNPWRDKPGCSII